VAAPGTRSSVAAAPTLPAKPSEYPADRPFMIPGLQNRVYTEQELDNAFAMMDLDNHGVLDERDLRRVLDLCGESEPTNSEVLEMVRMLDPEGSWKVRFLPFRKGFTDPPLLFRNFDLNRKESSKADGTSDVGTGTTGGSSGSRQEHIDKRGMAVAQIMGNRRLQPDIIKDIYQKCIQMDTQDSGFISFEAFCLVVDRPRTEAMKEAFDIFDVDVMGELDLRIFVVGLALYSMSADEDKLRFIFMMFDEEQQGTLTGDEIAGAFKALTPFLPAYMRDAHIRRMYSGANLSKAAGIPLDVFVKYVTDHRAELLPSSVSSSSKEGSSSGTPPNQTATPPYQGSAGGTPPALGSTPR